MKLVHLHQLRSLSTTRERERTWPQMAICTANRISQLQRRRRGQTWSWARSESRSGLNFGDGKWNACDITPPTQHLEHGVGVTIAAIAYSWGFPDQANFTRAFRKVYGTSPREYRRTQ
jgi:AraC-like DNA-binding protein